MTAAWNSLTPETQKAVAATFEALSLLDRFGEREQEQSPAGAKPIAFSDLYAFANNPDLPLSNEAALAMLRDPRLAADFARLLTKLSPYQAERQAAASTGGVEHWEGAGFTLDIRTSRAESSQVYIVVRLGDSTTRPRSLFVSRADSAFFKEMLPEAPGDTYQLLLDADTDIVRALRDPGSKVFLR